jgi:hypothetical protein
MSKGKQLPYYWNLRGKDYRSHDEAASTTYSLSEFAAELRSNVQLSYAAMCSLATQQCAA